MDHPPSKGHTYFFAGREDSSEQPDTEEASADSVASPWSSSNAQLTSNYLGFPDLKGLC